MNRTALKQSIEKTFRQAHRPQLAKSASPAPESHPTKRRETMKRNAIGIAGLALAAALAVGLSGCVSPTPNLDSSFGDAVRAARVAQTLNPDAGLKADVPTGLDGVAAKESIKRYHDSFKTPPPVTNVINIGGSVGGGGGQ